MSAVMGGPADAGSGPGSLREVLDAFAAGATSTHDIGLRTGLDRELVGIAVDQLVALGLLTRDSVGGGCPDGGCTGCGAPTGNGCSTPGPGGGLVTLSLSRRPG
jgi:hypothetical protein